MDKYLVDLYHASKKRKRKIKTNLIDSSYPTDLIHLDVSDLFEETVEKDHLISDGNIHINKLSRLCHNY